MTVLVLEASQLPAEETIFEGKEVQTPISSFVEVLLDNVTFECDPATALSIDISSRFLFYQAVILLKLCLHYQLQ